MIIKIEFPNALKERVDRLVGDIDALNKMGIIDPHLTYHEQLLMDAFRWYSWYKANCFSLVEINELCSAIAFKENIQPSEVRSRTEDMIRLGFLKIETGFELEV